MQALSGGFFQALKSFGLIALVALNFAENAQEKKPNVIFILTDQWFAAYFGKWHLDGHGRRVNISIFI